MIIIGIAGGSGSGKTTVVKKLIEEFSESNVTILSQDAYYKDNSHIPMEDRKNINFDHPDSIEWDLLMRHLEELKAGNSIEQPTYSYITCERQPETVTVKPSKVVLVEGIMVLSQKKLIELFDIKLFVDCASDLRLIRMINRDIVERGREVSQTLDRYEKIVRPSHEQFIEPSKQCADIIIPQGGENKVAINILRQFLAKINA